MISYSRLTDLQVFLTRQVADDFAAELHPAIVHRVRFHQNFPAQSRRETLHGIDGGDPNAIVDTTGHRSNVAGVYRAHHHACFRVHTPCQNILIMVSLEYEYVIYAFKGSPHMYTSPAKRFRYISRPASLSGSSSLTIIMTGFMPFMSFGPGGCDQSGDECIT